MIEHHLSESIAILDKLIALTQEDIANIKVAKHGSVEQSVQQKSELIKNFQSTKKRLDDDLIKLSDGGKKNLSQILSTTDKEQLGEFKKKLKILHDKNKEYAKLVLAVKNYFDGLVNAIFDEGSGTDNAYKDTKANLSALFKMNV